MDMHCLPRFLMMFTLIHPLLMKQGMAHDSAPYFSDTLGYQTQAFLLVKDCPQIKDSAVFIAALKANCHLQVETEITGNTKEQITAFTKSRMAGSTSNYLLIEYSRSGDENTSPEKYQLLFDAKGILVKVFSGISFSMVKIQDKEPPYLMLIQATAEGKGSHTFYRIENGRPVNVIEAIGGDCPLTYDSCQDETVNEPFGLNVSFKDVNKDGFKDIVFSGKIVLIQAVTRTGIWYDVKITKGKPQISYSIENPFRKIEVEYVFAYNKQTHHYEPFKDYSKYCTNHLALLLYRTLE